MMQTRETFQQENPDLHARIMALNSELSQKGARLNVTLPGALPQTTGEELLRVEPVPGGMTQAQIVGTLRDALKGLGFVLMAFGYAQPAWLGSLVGPEGQVALGFIIVAAGRLWSWWEGKQKAKLSAQTSAVALTLEPVWQGKVMQPADVERITKLRIETAIAAKKEGAL